MPDGTESDAPKHLEMLGVYMETRFRAERPCVYWPKEFVILSAYATTGQTWSEERNMAADRRLEAELRARGTWFLRIEGYSPSSGHCEPSWATTMPLEAAVQIGRRFEQDAIFYVHDETLSLVYCDGRRASQAVGLFLSRLDGEPNDLHAEGGC